MSYLVLARKWRPQTFNDLVGQEHVAQTLRNAITQDRIAHAFLFTGARGVGKTTIARVLAKSLNCMHAQSPTPDPCAKCDACEEIARGTDPDVKEIDGASNNSVDDVRRLQESLPYLPQRDRFKVVIIDEVHMLSTGAFNALLKTLEEPPPHVKFIFATTEVHKVPITILSRCQRYDFKLIPTLKIRERLEYILGQEGIAHDAAAVALVAREAAGSMRDALSLLDQVIAGVSGTLTGEEASRLIGVAARSVLYDLVRAVLSGDGATALRTVDSITREGYDLSAFARDVLAVIRDLVVARVVPDPGDLLDLADDERADVLKIAAEADRADLERLFLAWSRTSDEVGRAREPRWVLEMALVRLAHRPALVPVDELLARLADLEKRVGSGEPRGPGPAGSPGGGGSGRGIGSTSVGGGGGGARASAGPTAQAVVTLAPPAMAGPARPERSTARAPALSAEPRQSAPPAPVVTPSVRPAAPPVERLDVSMATALLDAWGGVVESMDSGPVAILKHAVPLEVSASGVRLAYETGSFYARKVAGDEVTTAVAAATQRLWGSAAAVTFVFGALPEDAPTLARRDDARRAELRAVRETAAREHPLVRSVVSILGGEVRGVKLGDE